MSHQQQQQQHQSPQHHTGSGGSDSISSRNSSSSRNHHNQRLPSPSAPTYDLASNFAPDEVNFEQAFLRDTESNNNNNNSANNMTRPVLSQEDSDAAIARRLQAEEEAAAYRRSISHSASFSAGTHDSPPTRPNPVVRARSEAVTSSRRMYARNHTRSKRSNRPFSASSQGSRSGLDSQSSPPQSSRPPILVRGVSNEEFALRRHLSENDYVNRAQQEIDDGNYARRVTQQEIDDAHLARRMQEKERKKVNNMQIAPKDVPPPRPISVSQQSRGCTRARWCSAVILALIVGGSSILVIFFGSSIWERLGGNQEDLPPFFQDKWGDDDLPTQEFSQWRTKGEGLKLTLINALTEDWYIYFDRAVREWGAASALSLKVVVADKPDPSCEPIPGVMKACNDAYGLLGWTGLNEVYFDGRDFITASVAKMNESYLKGTKDSEKQYVCCHELGHGFGLPHRDENANNPDLGTCLDYTIRFENNVSPDAIDYQNLQMLYGDIPISATEENKNNIRRKATSNDSHVDVTKVEHAGIIKTAQKARDGPESYKHGRLLYQSDRREVYERELNGGARVVTTLLLAR